MRFALRAASPSCALLRQPFNSSRRLPAFAGSGRRRFGSCCIELKLGATKEAAVVTCDLAIDEGQPVFVDGKKVKPLGILSV